ncbi:MAG: ribonuclease III [Clostridium sp.]|uniref:ribonuclease III n=1 Tax=Clostridium sp. DSM 8431 TaxID=1761781 RepID=UPI0008E94966|nr:ribonuclease III [Clostridium sp. DSM 8431]MCR4943635.1 ribonuclease III [Clostridium sp.]SFU36809.1 RNAse III [Clostridium sp. DSM 8431]
MNENDINQVESALKVKFNDYSYINIALTHSSYAKQFKDGCYNERLEFLGDSVLQLCVTEYLFTNYKKKAEGELTKLRSLIVCENSLYAVAQNIGLSKFIKMSKGEELTGGRERKSIQADAVEAVIAAIYLDRGIKEANKFILREFKSIIDKAIKNKIILDFKTRLQEYLQEGGEIEIVYDLVKFEGPPHRRKFYVNVVVKNKLMGSGSGFSKKEAEQNAAKQALITMGVIDE